VFGDLLTTVETISNLLGIFTFEGVVWIFIKPTPSVALALAGPRVELSMIGCEYACWFCTNGNDGTVRKMNKNNIDVALIWIILKDVLIAMSNSINYLNISLN
jgi:hypothetical protein